MFKTLEIENFRAFRRLTMTGLERVNLLVGKNNCGKSTVLEALEFLGAPFTEDGLRNALARRLPVLFSSNTHPGGANAPKFDARELFHNRRLSRDSGPSFMATGDGIDLRLRVECACYPDDISHKTLAATTDIDSVEKQLEFRWTLNQSLQRYDRVVLGRTPYIEHAELHPEPPPRSKDFPNASVFIPARGLAHFDAEHLVQQIHLESVLRQKMVTALRLIDPRVVDVRVENTPDLFPRTWPTTTSNRGLRLELEPSSPGMSTFGASIESQGDGIWRLLCIAAAMVNARGGLLLVDEIDTGLHYSVQRDLWNFVIDLAEELNVQVFATTHSYDCWTALADTVDSRIESGKEPSVSMSRLQAGFDRNVLYTSESLRAAAEIGSEVR